MVTTTSLSGDSPGGFGDAVPTHPVEVCDDGVYVGLAGDAPHVRTVSDVMAETLANWGVRHVFGMVGHSNLGLAVSGDAAIAKGLAHDGSALVHVVADPELV